MYRFTLYYVLSNKHTNSFAVVTTFLLYNITWWQLCKRKYPPPPLIMASFPQPSFDWNSNRETQVDRFKRHVDLMLSFNRKEFSTKSSKIGYTIITLGTRGVAFYYSTWDTKKYLTDLESCWLAFRKSMAPTTSVTPHPSYTTSVTPQPSPTTSATPQPPPTLSVTPQPSPTTSVMFQPLPLRTKPVTHLPSLAKSVIPS